MMWAPVTIRRPGDIIVRCLKTYHWANQTEVENYLRAVVNNFSDSDHMAPANLLWMLRYVESELD